MKMLVKNIILLLIFRRRIDMRTYPTLMIVIPCPKRSGSGSNILTFTFTTSNKMDNISRIAIQVVVYAKFFASFVVSKTLPKQRKLQI